MYCSNGKCGRLATKLCKCKLAQYCSLECRAEDWKRGHANLCGTDEAWRASGRAVGLQLREEDVIKYEPVDLNSLNLESVLTEDEIGYFGWFSEVEVPGIRAVLKKDLTPETQRAFRSLLPDLAGFTENGVFYVVVDDGGTVLTSLRRLADNKFYALNVILEERQCYVLSQRARKRARDEGKVEGEPAAKKPRADALPPLFPGYPLNYSSLLNPDPVQPPPAAPSAPPFVPAAPSAPPVAPPSPQGAKDEPMPQAPTSPTGVSPTQEQLSAAEFLVGSVHATLHGFRIEPIRAAALENLKKAVRYLTGQEASFKIGPQRVVTLDMPALSAAHRAVAYALSWIHGKDFAAAAANICDALMWLAGADRVELVQAKTPMPPAVFNPVPLEKNAVVNPAYWTRKKPLFLAIADTHFKGGEAETAKLRAFLRAVADLHKEVIGASGLPPEARLPVVVLGDIAQNAKKRPLNAAAAIFKEFDLYWNFVPGNHDTYVMDGIGGLWSGSRERLGYSFPGSWWQKAKVLGRSLTHEGTLPSWVHYYNAFPNPSLFHVKFDVVDLPEDRARLLLCDSGRRASQIAEFERRHPAAGAVSARALMRVVARDARTTNVLVMHHHVLPSAVIGEDGNPLDDSAAFMSVEDDPAPLGSPPAASNVTFERWLSNNGRGTRGIDYVVSGHTHVSQVGVVHGTECDTHLVTVGAPPVAAIFFADQDRGGLITPEFVALVQGGGAEGPVVGPSIAMVQFAVAKLLDVPNLESVQEIADRFFAAMNFLIPDPLKWDVTPQDYLRLSEEQLLELQFIAQDAVGYVVQKDYEAAVKLCTDALWKTVRRQFPVPKDLWVPWTLKR